VGAHLDDVLECLLGLVFEVLAALRKHVDGRRRDGTSASASAFA
jgi:hypothetical protein